MLKPIFRKMRTPANASCAQSSVVSSPHSTLCLTQVPISIYTRSESSCGLCSMPQRSPCVQQHLGKHPALWKQLWFPTVLGCPRFKPLARCLQVAASVVAGIHSFPTHHKLFPHLPDPPPHSLWQCCAHFAVPEPARWGGCRCLCRSLGLSPFPAAELKHACLVAATNLQTAPCPLSCSGCLVQGSVRAPVRMSWRLPVITRGSSTSRCDVLLSLNHGGSPVQSVGPRAADHCELSLSLLLFLCLPALASAMCE